MGRPDLAEDTRFITNAGRVNHHSKVVAALGEPFEDRAASERIRAFTEAGVPAAPFVV